MMTEMPLGSFLSIAASIILSGVCFVAMAFPKHEHRFPAEYMLPFLIGALGVLLEADWVLSGKESELRNLAWNLRDVGAAFWMSWCLIRREWPK